MFNDALKFKWNKFILQGPGFRVLRYIVPWQGQDAKDCEFYQEKCGQEPVWALQRIPLRTVQSRTLTDVFAHNKQAWWRNSLTQIWLKYKATDFCHSFKYSSSLHSLVSLTYIFFKLLLGDRHCANRARGLFSHGGYILEGKAKDKTRSPGLGMLLSSRMLLQNAYVDP